MKYAYWGAGMAAAVTLGMTFAANAEVPAQPTFTKDVLPILQENCQDCHRPKPIGTSGMIAPMPLVTYNEVRPWAKAIARAVGDRYMPPWFTSEEFHGVFRNERILTEEEIETILRWTQTGAARGNPEDAPPDLVFEDREWWMGQPDVIIPLPEPVWVADEVQDWQPTFYVDLTEDILPEDRWVKNIECLPGSEVVHHFVLYSVDPADANASEVEMAQTRRQIGGLAPGAEQKFLQDGYGILLKKGSKIAINMHYNKEAGPGTGVYDESKIGLFFYPRDVAVKEVHIDNVGRVDFEIPPGHPKWMVGAGHTFERPFSILNFLPHTHLRGVAAEYTAFYPDGRSEVLLDVPNYDYNWQLYYEYPEPRNFPADTRIEVKIWYDNSPENPSNPDPTIPMGFGIETEQEMAFGWMYFSYDDDEPRVLGDAAKADTDPEHVAQATD